MQEGCVASGNVVWFCSLILGTVLLPGILTPEETASCARIREPVVWATRVTLPCSLLFWEAQDTGQRGLKLPSCSFL